MQTVGLYRAIAHHHGVVTTALALEYGMSQRQIQTRERNGEWVRTRRGVYVVAGSERTALQRFELALSTRPTAVLSHNSAAELHQIRFVPPSPRPHITIPADTSRRAGDVIFHESGDLGADHVVTVGSLRCTTVERTLIDLGATLGEARLTRAVEDALDRKLTTPCRLNEALDRVAERGKNGIGAARRAIPTADSPRTESELERRFLRFASHVGLPTPKTQVDFHCGDRLVGRCDFVFLEAKLVVELDGQRGHTQRGDIERDHVRDQLMVQEGWTVIRVTWKQLTTEPDALAERLSAILRGRAKA